MTPDFFNGVFEFLGACFICLNVRRIWLDKKVAGVAVAPTFFFTSWGLWNLYYYPSLGQWWSFGGGVSIVIINAIWLTLAVYYGRRIDS